MFEWVLMFSLKSNPMSFSLGYGSYQLGMLNKPDWFILRMTSFCSAETSPGSFFFPNVAKTSDALEKYTIFGDVSW